MKLEDIIIKYPRTPHPFPSCHTRRLFLSGHKVWKQQELYDETWGEVVLLSGPGR